MLIEQNYLGSIFAPKPTTSALLPTAVQNKSNFKMSKKTMMTTSIKMKLIKSDDQTNKQYQI